MRGIGQSWMSALKHNVKVITKCVYDKNILMASLIAAAFLSCFWFPSPPRQICSFISLPRSHCSSNSSFISSQKLCSTQQAAVTLQQLFALRSNRFPIELNLPFNRPKTFSTTTLVMLNRLLKLISSRLRFPQSTYGFISQSFRG